MGALDGSRVQAPDIPDAQPLISTDLSGLNLFAAPPKPFEDNILGELANSLGHFSESVQRFGHYYNIAQRTHDAGQKQADMEQAQGLIASKTPEEWQAAVKAGQIPRFQSPMAQLAVDRTTGSYAAHSLSQDVQGKVASGELNWADGSATKYLQDQRNSILQTNGWAPDGGQARGFGDAFNTMWGNAQGQQIKAQAEQTNATQIDAAQKQVEMSVSNAFDRKLDPTATWSQLDAVRKGLITTMHFEPKELDPMIFDALQRRMSQDPNWVMGVGNAPRTDMDGKTQLPSLFSKGQYLDQVIQMQQRAQAFNAQQDDATQKAAIGARLGTMLNGPNPEHLASVPASIPYTNGVTGAQAQVSKATAVQAQVNARLIADAQRVASGQATPDQVQDEQLRTFARAGIKQPQWADTLNQAAAGGANVNSLTDPGQQKSLTDALQLYSNLRTKNPAYLNTLVDGKTAGFFEDAYLQQTLFNKSPLDALQGAVLVNSAMRGDPTAGEMAELRKAAEYAAGNQRFGGYYNPHLRNPEVLKDIVTRGATSLMKLNGMSAQDAATAAGEAANERFVNVNGVLLPDLHFLPKDQMEPAAERYLSDWANGSAKALKLDPKSLSLAPVGPSSSGQYLIIDGTSGLPITNGSGMSFVTGKDLMDTASTMSAEMAAQAKAAQDQQLQGVVNEIGKGRETRRGVSSIVPAGRDFTDGTDPDTQARMDADADARAAAKAKDDASWNAAMAKQNKAVDDADAARAQQEALNARAAHDRRTAPPEPHGSAFPDMGATFRQWDQRR